MSERAQLIAIDIRSSFRFLLQIESYYMDGNKRLLSTNTKKKASHDEATEIIIMQFEEVAENAGAVQAETLWKILKLNWGVEYLRKWFGDDFHPEELDATTLEALYTSLVPLSSRADVEPYIHRIADGDTSPLLAQHPITHLSLSSGTTDGRQKYVPFTHHSAQTTLQIFRIAAAYRSRVYPVREGGRILEFIYSSKQFRTKGGLTAGTATTHYYASKEFKIKQEKTKIFTCSPEEVISCGDYKQSTYCHLLLGLIFSQEVEFIASTFAYSILQAFIAFEDLWREICIDITQGSLNDMITISTVRESVLELLSPNPSLGAQIRAKCEDLEGLNWSGMIKKLWPNAKYVYSIMTGSMEPHTKKLKHYAGDLPLVSADYGSTESWIGVNVDPSFPPEKVSFAVVPTFSYFEFIPLHRRQAKGTIKCECHDDYCNFNPGSPSDPTEDFIEAEPVPLSKVKVGQEYEVVLTTFTGLYRYRLGDIVEVSGFHKGCPKLNFVCRRKLILTVNIDKNTERDLQLVVEKGSQVLKARTSSSAYQAELVDFTSHADVACLPGHYIIYWEIKGDVEEEVIEECCREMDMAFMEHGYREKVEQLLQEGSLNAAIICDNLAKVYPGRNGNPPKAAVRGLSLALPRGECFGMLGPNAAGKTSFISMMIGLSKPTSGRAFVDSKDILSQMDDIYTNMGVCPQHDLLWESLTGREHLLFYGRLKNLKGDALKQAVEESLKSVNLFHGSVGDKFAGKYSGGMKRRLNVAISLIGDPKVVYMDEPSTGLDPDSRNNLWNVLRRAKQDRAIILTTHSMEEAEVHCYRLGIFVDGSLQCIGNPKELKARYGGSFVFTITTSSSHEEDVESMVRTLSPTAQRVYHISGTQKFELPKQEVKISDVFRAVQKAKSQFTVYAWGLTDTTLEDVFIKVARGAQAFNTFNTFS